MPATQPIADVDRNCFVLTDIRTIEPIARSVLIDSIAGRDVTARMARPPQAGSRVQFNLGDQGWIDGTVRWAGGNQLAVELERVVDRAALVGS